MSESVIINRLLNIEAWAEGLRDECRKTRELIEGGVSTPSNHQKPVDEKLIASILCRKNKRLLKNHQNKTAASGN